MEIQVLHIHDMERLAPFITALNNLVENHIGYCGTNQGEVLHSLLDLHEEAGRENLFVAAEEDGQIIGVIGIDPDEERGIADIWGPFIRHEDWSGTAHALWMEELRMMPESIHALHLFCNSCNTRCAQFAADHGFQVKSRECILTFPMDRLRAGTRHPVSVLRPEEYEAFRQLHDSIFPETYYSGNEIVEMLDPNQAVFVVQRGTELAGYIFVQCNPEYGEGSIEFLGVAPAHRGRGYGHDLLLQGLRYIQEHGVDEVTLCVNADNQAAIRVYKGVGFEDTHYMQFFVKERFTKPLTAS